jgi:hypothetical protein
MHTSTSFWKLCQTKNCVVTGNRLKGDIAVPLSTGALLAVISMGVQSLALLRANDADLIICNTMFTTRVGNRMNVESGSLWLS